MYGIWVLVGACVFNCLLTYFRARENEAKLVGTMRWDALVGWTMATVNALLILMLIH